MGGGGEEGGRGWEGSRNVIRLRKEKRKLFFNVQSTTMVVSGRKTENYDLKLNTYVCEANKERRFHHFFPSKLIIQEALLITPQIDAGYPGCGLHHNNILKTGLHQNNIIKTRPHHNNTAGTRLHHNNTAGT